MWLVNNDLCELSKMKYVETNVTHVSFSDKSKLEKPIKLYYLVGKRDM